MASNNFSRLTEIIRRLIESTSEKMDLEDNLIQRFNELFFQAFAHENWEWQFNVILNAGNSNFRHVKSKEQSESGLLIVVMNDWKLNEHDLVEISKYFTENRFLITLLIDLGFDTLIIKGDNAFIGLAIPLHEIATLKNYFSEN